MAHFHDNLDRRWTLDITFDAIRRVMSATGVNLVELAEGEAAEGGQATPTLTRLGLDIVLLVDVIYALVKPQADQREVSDEDFGQALGGEAIAAARAAFWEGLTDFSRSLGRTDLVRAIEKQERVIAAAIAQADQRIESIDVDATIDRAFTGSDSSSPASSASTPAP